MGIRQPRNSAPTINDNSDVHERGGPKVNSDIVHRYNAPSRASASVDLRRRAGYHHPEKLLRDEEDSDEP